MSDGRISGDVAAEIVRLNNLTLAAQREVFIAAMDHKNTDTQTAMLQTRYRNFLNFVQSLIQR